jgi:hypothetical protein
VSHTIHPSTGRGSDHKFKDSLGYIVKACLKKMKKKKGGCQGNKNYKNSLCLRIRSRSFFRKVNWVVLQSQGIFVFVFVLETGSHFVAQSELAMYPRLLQRPPASASQVLGL